jgi:hypothetical protein
MGGKVGKISARDFIQMLDSQKTTTFERLTRQTGEM